MPKVAAFTVIWLSEQDSYVIREAGNRHVSPLPEMWFAWLEARVSFAFQGRLGHLTLRKETRAGREAYWYAYRCQNRRTIKRYAGRTADLVPARLEHITGEITQAFVMGQGHTEESGTGEQVIASVASAAPTTDSLLLTAKLRLPQLHPALILREHLLFRLDDCLEHTLTILCAPAGSGKTTLVRQWIAQGSTHAVLPPIAWVSLDAGDNDPMRFWRYVLIAMQSWDAIPDQQALSLLISSTQQSSFVLSQVQSIYRKLQVNNRHAASAVARRLHLC